MILLLHHIFPTKGRISTISFILFLNINSQYLYNNKIENKLNLSLIIIIKNESFYEYGKKKNPDKEYPSNLGKIWTDEEEILLLEKLNNNIDIDTIAEQLNRTKGGIYSRRNHIAYEMYLKNISMEEIIKTTKINEERIRQIIEKKQNYTPSKIKETKKHYSIESEIAEMKNDINEIKTTIKELVELMKAVYEFEDI